MIAPSRPALSIRELCFALAHRWEPERLFMFVFTGYLDESGTHGGSPITVTGGLLARAEQWERFEDGFAKLQEQHGFRVWHSKKFRNRKGDFKGWTNVQLSNLYWDLAYLTNHDLTEAVTMTLKNDDFENIYRCEPKPKKVRFDSKYGFCFRVCLYHFMNEVLKRQHRKKVPPLHIVLEAGHNNFGDAERIFLDVKKDLERHGSYMLRTITKADKDSCGQLMMADFAAHGKYLLQQKNPLHMQQRGAVAKIPKGMTPVSDLESTPENLAEMRARVIEAATPKTGPNSVLSVAADDDQRQSS
jgi:hypothetical protein